MSRFAYGVTTFLLTVTLFWGAPFAFADVNHLDLDWTEPAIQVVENNVRVTPETFDERDVLDVAFRHVEWPNVTFRPAEEAWDWEEWEILEIDVHNSTRELIPVNVRVDNEGAPAHLHCLIQAALAIPEDWTTIRIPLHPDMSPLWGMRGTPDAGAIPSGYLDPSRIIAFQVYLPRPTEARNLRIGGLRLLRGDAYGGQIELPFIDKFGQYKHEDWPGKIHSLEELIAARDAEEAAIAAAPSPFPTQDEIGGWKDGPQLEATGWFRTELVDGKWWLVTPEGRLFLSLGMTCIGTWERTFVEGREDWFDWIPDQDDPDYGHFFYEAGPAHSMADPIDGHGLVFTFYGANLVRKYGEDWRERWRDTAFNRLRAWGFNTLAAWSENYVVEASPIPFTAKANATSGVRPIAAGQGYWGRMADVYDPEFPTIAENNIAPVAQRFADNPLCIGFFVDNELGWDDIRARTLASPPDQPARMHFISMLQEKYDSIDQLNAAWATQADCWDTVERPASETRAARADFDAYVYAFATRYFQTVRDILNRHAPNHLYLGCRFAGAPEEAVFRASAENSDALSLNLYFTEIDPEDWNLERTYGKPVIIGEFHFGSLDRGLFNNGLQPVANQEERAAGYRSYVRSIASNPAFVGCHWFQYVDFPVTGRWYDGENCNIGFVTVTDTPYPELVEAAKDIHQDVYAIRAQQNP